MGAVGPRCLGAEANETDEVVWPAVASHGSAAYLWGLYRFAPETIDVTAPIRRRAKREFRVHFSSILAPEDRGGAGRDPGHLRAADAARPRDSRAAGPGWTVCWSGRKSSSSSTSTRSKTCSTAPAAIVVAGALRRALALYQPDPSFTRSRFERRFRRRVIAAGLPAPSMNFNVAGYELDAYWPDLRFAVELDLFETHGTRAAFERDRVRQEELKLLGIEMIRDHRAAPQARTRRRDAQPRRPRSSAAAASCDRALN